MVVALRTIFVAAVCAAAGLGRAAADTEATPAAETARADEEIIVRGRAYGDLRRQIQRAEELVYARFNDINSDDKFDIHCFERPMLGSRIRERVCQSNSWREQDANYAQAFLMQLRGETGAIPAQFRAEQLRMQRLLSQEMRKLSVEDPQLSEAVMRLGSAYRTMNTREGSRPQWTLFRPIPPGEDGLPYGAQAMYEVRMGIAPWNHRLTESTFTLAHVFGDIRKLELDCDGSVRELDYELGLEWTVPAGSRACDLRVSAKRGTTFALYEFE
jgi:hypothetical protein